jgi:hypothetical protein
MAVDKKISYEQARKKLNKAAPKGHQLAFITPAEANLLKSKGASGEMTKAGIRSYRGHHGGPSGSSSSGSSSSNGGNQGGNKSDKGGLKGISQSGMMSTSPNVGVAGPGGLSTPDTGGGGASVTGLVDKDKNPVTYGDEGEQVGFGVGLLSKGTPFSNQALEAALANPNSPSFGAAQTALAMNPSLGQDPAIQAAIVNNPALTQTAVQMGLKEDPNKPTLAFNDATLASIAQRINALKKSPFSTPFTPSLASIPTVNPTFSPNFAPTLAFAQATDDDADDTSKGLGLSLGEAIAQDFANLGETIAGIPSAVYGAVTDPIGTMESALQTPVGQYTTLSLPNIGPTAIGLSMLNFRPSFNEQGETIGPGYLGGLGVSTHLGFDTDNYGLDNEQDRVAFERAFYNALYSPADNVKGYTVDADAAQAVADQFGATYSGPAVSTQAPDRGGAETEAVPAEQPPTDDSGLPQQDPEQIQQDLTALYNSMTEQQRATIDKITQLPEYDLGFGIRYILEGGPLF